MTSVNLAQESGAATRPGRRDPHRNDRPGTDIAALRSAVDRRLAALAPPEAGASALDQAMRYALLAPGKRIRPLLVVLSCRELGRDGIAALDAACALEMVHAASLVLDDLPSMDDAARRRGRPTTHLAFGEDVAILASVSLLAAAFETLATSRQLDGAARGRAVALLAAAIGREGLAAGQHADLRLSARQGGSEGLAAVNHRKTGVLFVAAVEIAATLCAVDEARAERLRRFATHLGHAFQLLDDLADGPGQQGSGEDGGKPTLPALLGHEEARRRLSSHLAQGLQSLRSDGQLATFVREIFASELAGMESAARLSSET